MVPSRFFELATTGQVRQNGQTSRTGACTLEEFTNLAEFAVEGFTLESYILAVRGISDASDPQKRDEALRRVATLKLDAATTPEQKTEAYEFYKAYYENKPYTGEES